MALVEAPDMAIEAAFGSNLFNLKIIGLLDIFWLNRYIPNHVGMTSVVIGTFGIIVTSLASVTIILHSSSSVLSGLIRKSVVDSPPWCVCDSHVFYLSI